MKKLTIFTSILTLMCLSILSLNAQTTTPASPAAEAIGILSSGTSVKITYSSPSVKGRKIWGDIVPFDKVWRAGANQATQIDLDKDVKIHNKVLAAGKYSIYIVPAETSWVVLFSSQTGQGGMNHDGTTTLELSKVVLRTIAEIKKSKTFNERLVYNVSEKGMTLSWENLDIILPMK
ncbi:DUF2911 domain-containing protein [Aquirufa antheringensis]|jgi:hypothetical protein|uniref:DUF2911 domain-containing protein n=1 Tax=Aquirufa antheringensis TaxID=2516559 RepID=A0A4Q9BGS3_9BACT|nr:DUF2911 domain-containing protein [Aquirufa antheringensis]MCZ2484940.1 DUF2911 domain-containing protein [Aquirufa antheringensis]TBH75246.1 DUF2911 domain-containing protein [Aquirufa antheringensis]